MNRGRARGETRRRPRRAAPGGGARSRGALFAVAAWLGLGAVRAQEPAAPETAAPAVELRERFERFLTAPDAEAARLAETLLHEPPAVLAALARPASRPAAAPGAVVLVRAEGYEPPLAGVVVLPRAAPPAAGYPLCVAAVGPPLGPEEFELRARFGAVLAGGAAVLAPVETTAWLATPEKAASTSGREAWRLAPLCVAAERVLPLDRRRRVLLLGEPASRATPWQLAAASPAFAGVHWLLPGDGAAFAEELARSAAPARRFVLHHGPRLGENSARALRRFARATEAAGGEAILLEDARLEHAPTAIFAAPHATRAFAALGPNRAPTDLPAAAFGPTGPRGGAGVCFGVAAGEGAAAITGFGTAAPRIVVDEFAGETPWILDLPLARPAVDWSSPSAWAPGSIAPAPEVQGVAVGHVAPPDRARGRLFAFRLSAWSGCDFGDGFRIRVSRR